MGTQSSGQGLLIPLENPFVTKDTIVFNVKDHGAKGDGVTDDYPAIAALILLVSTLDPVITGATIFFPRGVYKINGTLNLQNSDSARVASIELLGQGQHNTYLDFNGNTGDGIVLAGVTGCAIKKLAVKNATGHGIAAYGVSGHDAAGAALSFNKNSFWVEISNVRSQSNGKSGIFLAGTFLSFLHSVWSTSNIRHGFEIGGYCTTTNFSTCWASTNTLSGWSINDITYSSFTGCGSDQNGNYGYVITNVRGLSFNGCGAEANALDGINTQASTAIGLTATSPDVKALSFEGFLGVGNGTSSNTYANLLNASSLNGKPCQVSLTACSDRGAQIGAFSIIATGGATVSRRDCDLNKATNADGLSSISITGLMGDGLGCIPTTAWYYGSSGTPSTVTFSAVGKFHATPFHLAVAATLTRIGCGVTVIGDAGSKVRLGIYTDTNGLPDKLVVDAGQVAGDVVANPEIVLGTPLLLPPGRYWLVAVGQNFTVTSPTVRSLTNSSDATGAEAIGTLLAFGISGLAVNSITGALPASGLAVVGALANTARVAVRFNS